MPIPFDKIPRVALDFMNRDHEEFVSLHGAVLEVLRTSSRLEDLERILADLALHLQSHFAAEEDVMQRHRFPAYPVHLAEHRRVLADVEARYGRWRSDRDGNALADWLDGEVAAWFLDHVASMDTVTAGYIAQRSAERLAA